MTRLLEQAIEKLKQLSPPEQDFVASKLLEEVADMEALKEKITLGIQQCDSGDVVDGDTVFRKLHEKAKLHKTNKQK